MLFQNKELIKSAKLQALEKQGYILLAKALKAGFSQYHARRHHGANGSPK